MRRAVLGGRAAAEPNELGGAAADVEQDHAIGGGIDQRRAAGRGKPRLGLAVDDLEIDADLVADALEEIEAVAGRAAGLGRDQPRTGDAAISHLGAADAQCVDRAQDRRLAQQTGIGDALAEPDDARERIDHPEAVAGRARHQQSAVVGAKIERSIGRAGHIQPALPAATVLTALARMPIRRPPAPPGPLRAPVRRGVEAGRPGLVVHRKPFPAPKLA